MLYSLLWIYKFKGKLCSSTFLFPAEILYAVEAYFLIRKGQLIEIVDFHGLQ